MLFSHRHTGVFRRDCQWRAQLARVDSWRAASILTQAQVDTHTPLLLLVVILRQAKVSRSRERERARQTPHRHDQTSGRVFALEHCYTQVKSSKNVTIIIRIFFFFCSQKSDGFGNQSADQFKTRIHFRKEIKTTHYFVTYNLNDISAAQHRADWIDGLRSVGRTHTRTHTHTIE